MIGVGFKILARTPIPNPPPPAKHGIYPAHKCKTVGVLTFINMIDTAFERLKARNLFICRYFSFYGQLKNSCLV